MEKEFDSDFRGYLNEALGKDPIYEQDEEEIYLEIGSKLSIELVDEFMCFFSEDYLFFIFEFPVQSKKSFKSVSNGIIDISLQMFKKEDFDLNYDCLGFSLTMCEEFFCDFRLGLNKCDLNFDKIPNISLNIIAVDNKRIIKAMRSIMLPRGLCKIIQEHFKNVISQGYDEDLEFKDVEKINNTIFDGITIKEFEESFSVYTFSDKPEKEILDKYID